MSHHGPLHSFYISYSIKISFFIKMYQHIDILTCSWMYTTANIYDLFFFLWKITHSFYQPLFWKCARSWPDRPTPLKNKKKLSGSGWITGVMKIARKSLDSRLKSRKWHPCQPKEDVGWSEMCNRKVFNLPFTLPIFWIDLDIIIGGLLW